MFKLLLILLVGVRCSVGYPAILTPNAQVSPGSFCTKYNKDFLELRYGEQIAYCMRNVSTKTKNEICKRDGVNDRTHYTVDHIIPLSLGGSNHSSNLWCQRKDLNTSELEYFYYKQVSRGILRWIDAVEGVLSCKFYHDCLY
jgi:hypothetical protein